MKLLSLATVRTGNEIPDPIVCTMGSELSSFGFFQRPVSRVEPFSSSASCGYEYRNRKRGTKQNGKVYLKHIGILGGGKLVGSSILEYEKGNRMKTTTTLETSTNEQGIKKDCRIGRYMTRSSFVKTPVDLLHWL